MYASRKAPVLTAAAAVGLVAVTAIVTYTLTGISSRSSTSTSSSSSSKPSSARDEEQLPPSGVDGSTEGKNLAMNKEEETAPAAPLVIAPADAGVKALVVCADGAEEASIAAGWSSSSRSAGATVSVCPPGFLQSHSKSSAGTYDSVVVEAGKGVSDAVLGEVLKLLKAGGKVNVVIEEDATAAAAATTSTKRALTFAGFVKVSPSPEDDRVLAGQRASWEAGASAPVRLSLPKTNGAASGVAPAAAAATTINGSASGGSTGWRNGNGSTPNKTWTLALDDDDGVFGTGGGDEDDDLVDEDALLEGSAPVKRASEVETRGCATRRRACKDCSCGRADMEVTDGNGAPRPVVSVADVDDAMTSACGNCSKGDAFRCGGCPFLGKPAFEKGQERLVMLSDLDAQQDD